MTLFLKLKIFIFIPLRIASTATFRRLSASYSPFKFSYAHMMRKSLVLKWKNVWALYCRNEADRSLFYEILYDRQIYSYKVNLWRTIISLSMKLSSILSLSTKKHWANWIIFEDSDEIDRNRCYGNMQMRSKSKQWDFESGDSIYHGGERSFKCKKSTL